MDFFGLFRSKNKGSKNTAKDRLQLVLVHDRAGVSPAFLDHLKGEIMAVISKYIEIENDELDIKLTKTTSDDGERVVPALVANIPINKMKAASKNFEQMKEDVKVEEPEEVKEEEAVEEKAEEETAEEETAEEVIEEASEQAEKSVKEENE